MKNNNTVWLIILVWLITFIAFSFFLDDTFEFDEAKYLACARGIAESLDFSSRSVTVQGLIKHGFPQNSTHYPLNSLYIAMFFKLFGSSLNVAYLSTWFSLLLTCIFIYFSVLLLCENNKLFSLIAALSFLFFPRVVNFSNSVMMEIPGCALISFFVFVIFKDISKGKLNPILFAIASCFLFFYKSLFLGVVFGLLALIILFYNSNFTKLFPSMAQFVSVFFVLYFIFKKFIFLPLGPWLVFDLKQVESGSYADFDGGFSRDIYGNLRDHLYSFVHRVISHYYPFITIYPSSAEALYHATPHWYELAIYFLVIFYTIVFSFILWNKFSQIQKIFILFSITTVLIFNLILIAFIGSSVGSLCRYNMIYVPLVTISTFIILYSLFNYFNPLLLKYKNANLFLLVSLIVIVYLPYFYSACLVKKWNDNFYYNIAHKNTEILKRFIGDKKPRFVYFLEGTLLTWDLFPIRDIYMDASSEDIKKMNTRLPEPIEFLFLNPACKIFKENEELIKKAQPILNGLYTFYGYAPQDSIVAYKLRSQNIEDKQK